MDIDTIALGDCYKLIKEVPDKSVDLIVTDPPYDFGGNLSHKTPLSQRKTYRGIDSSGINKGFDRKILDEFVRVRKKTNIYIWCNKEQVYDYLTYFVKERGFNWERLVWAKMNPPPFCHGHYLKDKEYCLYFWETGVELKTTYKTGKTVFVKAGMTEKEKYGHPTAKPEDIIETLIANSCPAGGGRALPLLRQRDDMRKGEEARKALPRNGDRQRVLEGIAEETWRYGGRDVRRTAEPVLGKEKSRMAEQKPLRKTATIEGRDTRTEYEAKLGKLGGKGKQRLVLFMSSLGFSCEDMAEEGKMRFYVGEGDKEPDRMAYNLAVGACLCQGYDCVSKDGEIIADYRKKEKKAYVRKDNHKGPWAGNNPSLFKGRYYIKATDIVTNEETGWFNRIQLCKALGGDYTELSKLFVGVTRCFNGYTATFSFHNRRYIFEFKEDPGQKK